MKVVVGTFVTLDGVIQGPGGPEEDRSGDFEHGGWLVPYFDDMMGELITGWTEAADGLLLGRRTYEIFAAHWPHIGDEDPIAAKLNRVHKYVASRTLQSLDWQNSSLLKGDVAEAVAKLKREPGRELQVTGSGNLIQTLLQHNLVDEFRLWTFPVLLGKGKRLFAEGTVPAALKLTDTKTSSTGVLIHTYECAGRPEYGSFQLEDPPAEEIARRQRIGGIAGP
ncbi:dihydrofolate reductase family protein [Lysobacter sp. CFH 32150]|uniref:dihydrofolate reductase family protein n=1 Tax=Lysobacter sp. CFH 32150 TaxID=2927128 RepID=UPI001FA7D6BE|nr:dihydrofolate reductase family protein [Lysobacter sp. CFH 32150]MCI4569322.1 dihydrofolate reductase family protein [Lysobacter sp. CFH 32150]